MKGDRDCVAVGLNVSRRFVATERAELSAAGLNLTHKADQSLAHTLQVHVLVVCGHLDIVVGAADVRMVLHIEARVKLEAEPKARLHLNPIHTLGALWVRGGKIDAAQTAGALPEHTITALH